MDLEVPRIWEYAESNAELSYIVRRPLNRSVTASPMFHCQNRTRGLEEGGSACSVPTFQETKLKIGDSNPNPISMKRVDASHDIVWYRLL